MIRPNPTRIAALRGACRFRPGAYREGMSNLDSAPQEATISAGATAGVRDLLVGHEVALGGARAMTVTRTLPNRGRRMVGAWCFADAYGPTDLSERPGMRVPPHPHTALQTVSWLLDGEVLHRDSLGNQQLIRPGQLNLMTAGRGISHSEETPPEHSRWLHGVQLWVALPEDDRRTAPRFEHHGELPVLRDGGVDVTVVMGELAGVISPARTYTPLVCADAAMGISTIVSSTKQRTVSERITKRLPNSPERDERHSSLPRRKPRQLSLPAPTAQWVSLQLQGPVKKTLQT